MRTKPAAVPAARTGLPPRRRRSPIQLIWRLGTAFCLAVASVGCLVAAESGRVRLGEAPLPGEQQAFPTNASRPALSPNIVGGALVPPGKYPWVALLGWVDAASQRLSPMCTGALISPTLILTAAHCVKYPLANWIVAINRAIYNLDSDANKGFYFRVTKVWTAPGWTDAPVQNDLALFQIELNNAGNSPLAQYGWFGNPSRGTYPKPVAINLAFPNIPSQNADGRFTRVQSAGWGLTRSYTGALVGTNNLLEASLPVISKTRCLASFSGIDGAVICAGGEANKNVCNGDSGGPLFVRDDAGSWVVVGVTSRGPPDCGVPGTPAIWTRVSAYSNFISSVVAQSDADAAAGRIWTDPTFRTYRAPLPVINGIRQVMGTPVRTERVRVSKLPFVKRNRGPKRNAAKAQHA